MFIRCRWICGMGAVDNPEFSGFVGTTGNVYREWSPE